MTEMPEVEMIEAADPLIDRDRFNSVRAPYFGVSAAACLFGKHPFMSAADYWLQKVSGEQQEETMPMRRGQHLEPAVASWFAAELGEPVTKAQYMYVRGHLAASPDYWLGHNTLVEIKTTAKRVDEPEEYWVWQVQGQMLCSGASKAYIVWVDASMDIQWTEVDADVDAQKLIWNRSFEFMQSIDQELMPDWVETEARHIIAMYPEPSDAIEAGDKGMELVTEYWSHKAASKYHDTQANVLRDELFTLAGNHDTITDDGTAIATLMPRKLPAKFNAKAFKEAHPNLYLEYMTEPMTTRVLNVPTQLKKVIENHAD